LKQQPSGPPAAKPPVQCSGLPSWPNSHDAFQAAEHMQFVVAVGATSSVACMRSKPWTRGLDG
jgi:hypothetical protein